MRHRSIIFLLALCLLVVMSLLFLFGRPRKPWQGITAQEFARVDEHRILGIALLENSRKPEAAAEFKAIQKAQPGLAFGYVNEAAALVGMANASKAAVEIAQKGVDRLPRAVWPRVVLAKAYQSASQPEKAVQVLEEAVRLEPRNPRILGALVKQLNSMPGDHGERLYLLRRDLAAVAPDNMVAQIEWAQAQAERREWAGSLAALESTVRLIPRLPPDVQEAYQVAKRKLASGNPEAERALRLVATLLVGRLGPLNASLWRRDSAALFGSEGDPADLLMRDWGTPPPPLPEPALPPVSITWKDVTGDAGLASVVAQGSAPVAVGDIDLPASEKSYRPDLVGGSSAPAALLNQGPKFTQSGPLAIGPGSPLLADLNNDFSLDLYVAGPTGDRLWKNPRRKRDGSSPPEVTSGSFTPAPSPPGKGPGTALAVDLDQDGDLDIIRAYTSPDQPAVRYLRNNGNLTFTDLTTQSGLRLPSQAARQAVFGDFDNDGDPDLLVVRSEGPCQLFLNRRQDLLVNATGAWGIRPEAGARSAAVADFDRDGDWDVAMVGRAPHGSLIYRNAGGKFEADSAALPSVSQPEWVEFLDYDNDTWLDLVVAGEGGIQLLHNDHGRFSPAASPLAESSPWVTSLDYDQDGDLDLLATDAGGKVRLLSNEGGNARPWLKVMLQGYILQGLEANNSYAIGAELEPRTVWDEQKRLVKEPQTHVGLGRAGRAVAVRVTWTHGVPDNVIAPKPSEPVRYVQISRVSCPFLYTWDGEKWRFATDFNWRSPLGMLFARGAPIPHDQTGDWVKIPGEWIRPSGSYYQLIATEELREVSYFDLIEFRAIDHPADTEIYLDERFRFGPQPPFQVFTATRPRLPVTATDERGTDLLPALRTVDNVYTPVPPGIYRGFRAPHDLIMDLGKVPDPSNIKLFLHGWIYPPGTSTNIAASQNPDVTVIPPVLYVGDGKGGWTEADRNVGLPCGKRKTIVLDLGGRFVGNDFRLKLRTTMEIRWDAAFFTSGEEPAPLRQTSLPLVEADLQERGYGTHYKEAEEGPDLWDYNRLLTKDQEPHWPPIAGAYTRTGDCAPLLRKGDNRFAIIGPGDGIQLLYDGRTLPPLPPGWKRDFVVITDGWTKDSDKNTVTGEQVGPLPFHGMKRYPYGPDERFPDTPSHRRWQREWNTRVK
jgi:tetratricopeptide (TPR) repeat protein